MGTISIQEAKEMIDSNYEYFKKNIDALCEMYYGKYISVKNEAVLGSYESFDQAYNETIKSEELGSFLIMQCVGKDDASINNFYSNNVVFA